MRNAGGRRGVVGLWSSLEPRWSSCLRTGLARNCKSRPLRLDDAKCNSAIQRFKGELFACLAAIESNAPERAVHAHNLAGVAGLLGFDDLEVESRQFLAALHQNTDDIRASAESFLQAAQRVEAELDAIS